MYHMWTVVAQNCVKLGGSFCVGVMKYYSLTFSWWPLMKAESEQQIVSTFVCMYVCVCALLCIFKGCRCHRATVCKAKGPTGSS